MRLFACICVVCAIVAVCPAQFEPGAAAEPAWRGLKLDKKKRISFHFANARIEGVVRFLSEASGANIVKDPSLSCSVTLNTPKPVGLNEAFSLFAAILELQGYEFKRQDTFLVIKKKPTPPSRGLVPGFPSAVSLGAVPGGGGPGGGQPTELRTYVLEYANAVSVAKTINEVFGQSSGAVTFGGAGPGFPGGGPAIRPPDSVETLDQLVAQLGGGGGAPGGGRQGSIGPPISFNQEGLTRGRGGSPASTPNVKASSDEYSNTVIVNAPTQMHSQIASFIRVIDKEVKQPYETHVYPLIYASATELVSTIESVLNASTTKGRGGAQQLIDQRFRMPLSASSGSQNTQGSAVADTRTNSLVVTATKENQTVVSEVVARLDKEVPISASTAVIPLANARASDLATLLNQAFGNRSSSSNRSTSTSGGTTGNTNRSAPQGSTPPGGGATGQPDPNSLYLKLSDPNASSGELETKVAAQGGFPLGQTGGSQRTSSSDQNTYRDAQGRVVNVSDLSGRVTIVADPNTNGLIVVGDPEAVALLKQMLEQLDRIPEQVMIETLIVEASLDSESKFGLEWSHTASNSLGIKGGIGKSQTGFGLAATDEGFRYTLAGSDLTAFLNAFKSDQRFHVLSTPRIFTSNNVEATINISQSVPYITSQREDTNGNITYNYSFQDIGIVLTVTPRISASGMVSMEIEQTANELQGFTSFNAPIVNQREATTTVSVMNGETIVLGGIMRKSVSATTKKVPLLGDLPVLGNLFRTTARSEGATELLVFLTPRIVKTPEDAKSIADKTKDEMGKTAKGLLKGGG